LKQKKRRLSLHEPKTIHVGFRLSDVEYKMLKRLSEYWRCSYSEALRRTIVYTFVKYLLGEEITEETLQKIYLDLKNLKDYLSDRYG